MPGVNGTDYTMRIFNSDGSEPEVSLFYNDMFFLVSFCLPLEVQRPLFFLSCRCVAMELDALQGSLLSLRTCKGKTGTLFVCIESSDVQS